MKAQGRSIRIGLSGTVETNFNQNHLQFCRHLFLAEFHVKQGSAFLLVDVSVGLQEKKKGSNLLEVWALFGNLWKGSTGKKQNIEKRVKTVLSNPYGRTNNSVCFLQAPD